MRLKVLSFALALAGVAPAVAQPAPAPDSAPTTDAPNSYADPAAWLCRPGRQDACAQDQTATIVAPDGRLTVERYAPATAPQVDCFYVYPTVSTDPTPNSDMHAGAAEQRVIAQQFARFGAVCRQFAPLYRQVTLSALRAAMLRQPASADRELAYRDVRDAWRSYLQRDNGGRGFVLIGHSQGSGVLTRLIKEEIDGKPIQRQMISALLAGTRLPIPGRSRAPLAFSAIQPCAAKTQLGCVVAFASFRETSPPPPNSRFGKVDETGEPALCVNPAALGGGEAPLDAYLSNGTAVPPRPELRPVWVKGGPPITTPFVKVPGLLSARCVEQNGFGYLAVRVNADPADPRTDEIRGDLIAGGVLLRVVGLHLIDMNLTMGDLVGLVRSQSAAYLARR